jgi:hypothetical protein
LQDKSTALAVHSNGATVQVLEKLQALLDFLSMVLSNLEAEQIAII